MSVQFEEEQQFARTTPARGPKGIPALLVSWGLAKDEKQATRLLLLASGIALACSIGILVFGSGSRQAVSPEEYQDPGRVTLPPRSP